MRHLLFFLMSLCAACTAITSCSRTNDTVPTARQQAWLDLITLAQKDRQAATERMDSLEQAAPDAGEHEQVLRRLAHTWLSAIKAQQGVSDSVLVPVVNYLESHGTPREQVYALLLRAKSLEWKGRAADAQLTYQQALCRARQGGDSLQVLFCWRSLGSFYALRTDLHPEMTDAYRHAIRLAEQLGDAYHLSVCHAHLGRLYVGARPGDSLYDCWQDGVVHYRKAAELARQAGSEFAEMTAKYELAALYMTRQHPHEALPLLQETKDFQFRTFPDSKAPTLFSLITVFLQLDRPDSAQVYIDQALALPSGQNNIRYHVYEMLFQYYQAKKRADLAAWAADSMFYYTPMVARQQVSAQVAEIKEKYDNERLTNERNRIRMERDRSVIIGLSLTVALLGIIILLTAAYRRRLRRIREQLRQDAIRLHDNEETLRQNSQSIALLQAQLADEHQESKAQQDELQAAIDALQQQNKTLDAENQRLQSSLDHYQDKYDTEEQRILRQQAERLRQLEAHEQALVEELIRRDSLVQLLRRQPKFLGEGEWKKLALLTDSIYNRFTVRLKERFPQLTDVDLQYCILIKLRFTVSQIAILMAVSPSSVSQQKSRLKKRLQQSEGFGLSPGEMLDSWLWRF